ncbi:LptA/OstA family protein [Vulgatibacter incomptus]|uniref:Organic solvent tolerance-like N-terminal domain-containing protein n=1 Tax=Vulgatibacter incomptus TaxID=1391653 RepID=A0A0K1PFF1_9BACT|nr:LptA/OstA family protein [Vulgatibacter incomptus]AKU92235.1 hypothetical protein AKJ08_2622 [Vulgatibacter incomptus]
MNVRSWIWAGSILAALPSAAKAVTPPDESPAAAVEPAAATREPSAPIDLRSETLTVDHRRHRAVFGGGVVASRGDLEVRCPMLTAVYDNASRVREVSCDGPVSATQGARTMTSRSGYFDNVTGELHLSGETTLVEEGRSFSGETLVYETGSSQATLVRARAELSGDDAADLPGSTGPMRITADKVTHDFARHRTIFSGNVVAVRGDVVVRASRLVTIGDDRGHVESGWTEGGPVRVEQGARQGTAERAHFAGGGKRLVLEGNPVITEGSSSLRGDRAVFQVGQGRVEIEKPRAVFPVEELQKGTK